MLIGWILDSWFVIYKNGWMNEWTGNKQGNKVRPINHLLYYCVIHTVDGTSGLLKWQMTMKYRIICKYQIQTIIVRWQKCYMDFELHTLPSENSKIITWFWEPCWPRLSNILTDTILGPHATEGTHAKIKVSCKVTQDYPH